MPPEEKDETPGSRMLLEYQGQGGPGNPELPKQTGMAGGDLSVWERLKRPGYTPTTTSKDAHGNVQTNYSQEPGTDIAKILAQLTADYAGGGPIGLGISAGQAILKPESVRPLLGLGNVTSALTGNFGNTTLTTAFPALSKVPQAIKQGIGGLFHGGAEAQDFGNNPLYGAMGGGIGGAVTGGLTDYLHGQGNKLSSPQAEKINRVASGMAETRPEFGKTLTQLEENLTMFPKVASAQEALLGGKAKLPGMEGLLTDAGKSFEEAKAGRISTATARRSAVKGQQTAKINAATKAGEEQAAAVEFLVQERADALNVLAVEHVPRNLRNVAVRRHLGECQCLR